MHLLCPLWQSTPVSRSATHFGQVPEHVPLDRGTKYTACLLLPMTALSMTHLTWGLECPPPSSLVICDQVWKLWTLTTFVFERYKCLGAWICIQA